MANKELIIDHAEISNSQSITPVMERKFKERNMDIHMHDVVDIQDDFRKGIRKVEVRQRLHHFIGDIPWHTKK